LLHLPQQQQQFRLVLQLQYVCCTGSRACGHCRLYCRTSCFQLLCIPPLLLLLLRVLLLPCWCTGRLLLCLFSTSDAVIIPAATIRVGWAPGLSPLNTSTTKFSLGRCCRVRCH
jgi:hypothetical protein